MTYPAITDYNEAVQTPRVAFSDPQLKAGTVECTPLGLPLALSGGFALTYSVRIPAARFAVRCFHRQIPDVEAKYDAIAKFLNARAARHFVQFDFQPNGVLVKGKRFPIVKMAWIDGPTLGLFLDQHAKIPSQVRAVRDGFRELALDLETLGVAHGDLQNGNVIVTANGLRLIDYDGLFVPGMSAARGSETGHKHFQHPKRTTRDFGPKMDRFASIVIDVSLSALEENPTLHARFNAGGETILFRANDLADPSNSPVFAELQSMPQAAVVAERFARVCTAPIGETPTLADFVLGRNIPSDAVTPVRRTRTSQTRLPYVSPYEVLSAGDYKAALAKVGSRVELIGRIYEVSKNVNKYKRPYVFVNFGAWRGNIVKLAIWSPALQKFQPPPDKSWEGRYVSVTGLLDAPFTSKYGYTHISITMSEPSEIQFIDAEEAAYRLGHAPPSASVTSTTSKPTNRKIVDGLTRGPSAATRKSAKVAPASLKSSNQAIAAALKASSRTVQRPAPAAGRPMPTAPRGANRASIWPVVWWGIILSVVVGFCAGLN